MLRTITLFAGLLFASASELTEQANPQFDKYVGEGDWAKKDQLARCAIHGAEAVDSLFDAAVYTLASVERCEQQNEQVRCIVDVASAISSVNEVVNVVLKAVSNCGAFDSDHARCGMATGVLTRAMGELTASSAAIVVKCPHKGTQYGANIRHDVGAHLDTHGFSQALGQCIINVKDSVKELFNVIARFMTLKTNCVEEASCAHNALKIVAAFSGLAQYIAGSIARCHPNAKAAIPAICTQASLELFRSVDNVARAGEAMSQECKPTEAERLFLDNEGKVSIPSEGNGLLTFGLVALLPITAVLSFVGGSRLAKARTAFSEPRDAESLMAVDSDE